MTAAKLRSPHKDLDYGAPAAAPTTVVAYSIAATSAILHCAAVAENHFAVVRPNTQSVAAIDSLEQSCAVAA